jgi:UDP-N-acetylglucosamine--N-acetylmuramyl-(pentapeptide) pyrophosphoryl-undecaprenol N-acetylglucosamine transferase
MELALGAATLAISRAGASSLAEQAAMRVPSILIPYPTAADNHQFHNAQAFVEAGSARQIDQSLATPGGIAQMVVDLLKNQNARNQMSEAVGRWFASDAAEKIGRRVLQRIAVTANTAKTIPEFLSSHLKKGGTQESRKEDVASRTCLSFR